MNYFAYGSNMELGHIRKLCGWGCRMLGRAELDGFEIGLDKRGYANIRPKAGETVFGVLYEIDQESLQILDDFEGYPQVFNRRQVTVCDDGGQSYQAWVYVESEDQFGGNYPNLNYWRRVIDAAGEHKLSQDWIKKLRGFTESR